MAGWLCLPCQLFLGEWVWPKYNNKRVQYLSRSRPIGTHQSRAKSASMVNQAIPKLSILEKSDERSLAKKYLHGNFKSGHKTPNEHYLGRAGLRGRKRWICCALLVLVYLFALAHLTLTCVILGVLRFNEAGSSYLAFQDDGSLVLLQGANLSDIRLYSPSTIRSFTNQTLHLSGDQDDEVILQTSSAGQLSVDGSSVIISSETLQVYSRRDQQPQLSMTASSIEMNDLVRANSLKTPRINTNIVSNVGEVSASNQLFMRGAAGVTVEGNRVDFNTNGNISLSSVDTLNIEGEQVFLSGLSGVVASNNVYHLCLCDNGRLFLVQANSQRCSAADSSVCG